MAKVKFEAEDFKKDPNQISQIKPKPNHFSRYWKRYIGSAFIIVIGITAIIFWPMREANQVPPIIDSINQVVNTPKAEIVDTINETEQHTTRNIVVPEKKVKEATKPKIPEVSKSKSKTPQNSIGTNTRSDEIFLDAKKAIRGDFGNGAERRKKLGEDYEKVQAIVNKMYREGKLYW